MVVVPKDDQINGSGGVGQLFFEMTLGRLGKEGVGKRIFNGILAVSIFSLCRLIWPYPKYVTNLLTVL